MASLQASYVLDYMVANAPGLMIAALVGMALIYICDSAHIRYLNSEVYRLSDELREVQDYGFRLLDEPDFYASETTAVDQVAAGRRLRDRAVKDLFRETPYRVGG